LPIAIAFGSLYPEVVDQVQDAKGDDCTKAGHVPHAVFFAFRIVDRIHDFGQFLFHHSSFIGAGRTGALGFRQGRKIFKEARFLERYLFLRWETKKTGYLILVRGDRATTPSDSGADAGNGYGHANRVKKLPNAARTIYFAPYLAPDACLMRKKT
jgi:hypothetical protein